MGARLDSVSFPPIDRPAALAARVAGVLRVAMIAGELTAGERLVPERIAEEVAVSRPSVMAAIRQLEREGLVTIGANGRPYVVGLTSKYVADLYHFRMLLDEAVMRAVLGRVPVDAEAHLRRIITAMAAHADEGDLGAFADQDLAFHGAYLALADNQFLLGAWQAMSDVVYALLTVTDRLFALLPQLATLHASLLESLCRGDETATVVALRQHYEIGEHALHLRQADGQQDRLRQADGQQDRP